MYVYKVERFENCAAVETTFMVHNEGLVDVMGDLKRCGYDVRITGRGDMLKVDFKGNSGWLFTVNRADTVDFESMLQRLGGVKPLKSFDIDLKRTVTETFQWTVQARTAAEARAEMIRLSQEADMRGGWGIASISEPELTHLVEVEAE